MKIVLPFSYEVRGLFPRHRTPSDKTFIDNVEVNIPEVSPSDFEHALTLVNHDTNTMETFYHHDGSFWIEDTRDDSHEITAQHHMLAGRWPRKAGTQPYLATARERNNYRPYTREMAESDNREFSKELAVFGFLRRHTNRRYGNYVMNKGELTDKFVLGPSGVEGVPTFPENEFRHIERNSAAERRLAAVEYAQTNVRSVAGRLWHRVPPPVVYSTDKKVDWCFASSFGDLSTGPVSQYYGGENEDRSALGAYRMPMCAEETLEQAFPAHFEHGRVAFSIEYLDERFFEPIDLRKGVVRDIKDALRLSNDLSKLATPQIITWCALRDFAGEPRQDFLQRGEEFFDEVASLLLSMEEAGLGPYPGAAMWNDREVSSDMMQALRSGPTP
jgi:hypothetical protein